MLSTCCQALPGTLWPKNVYICTCVLSVQLSVWQMYYQYQGYQGLRNISVMGDSHIPNWVVS